MTLPHGREYRHGNGCDDGEQRPLGAEGEHGATDEEHSNMDVDVEQRETLGPMKQKKRKISHTKLSIHSIEYMVYGIIYGHRLLNCT